MKSEKPFAESPRPADVPGLSSPKAEGSAELREMSRVLYRHEWIHVEDWARHVGGLADLSDEQIQELESIGGTPPAEARRRPPAGVAAAALGGLVERVRHLLEGPFGFSRIRPRRSC